MPCRFKFYSYLVFPNLVHSNYISHVNKEVVLDKW